MKEIIFYQPIISPHQVPMLNEIVNKGADVTIVILNESDRHETSGWGDEKLDERIKVMSNVTFDQLTSIFLSTPFNIISGLCICTNTRFLMKLARKNRTKVYIYSEGGSSEPLTLVPRWIKNFFYATMYKRNISKVFAIGEKGEKWFRSLGIDSNKIVPFKYYTKIPQKIIPKVEVLGSNVISIVFLGRLVKGKGIIKLIDLISKSKLDLNLNIYGDGYLAEEIIERVKTLNLEERVHMMGMISNSKIADVFQNASILALINDGDEGWGAVVNESLLYGVPVICSKKTGASSLLRSNSNFGCVLNEISVSEFDDAIEKCIRLDKDVIAQQAIRSIHPSVGCEIIYREVGFDNN